MPKAVVRVDAEARFVSGPPRSPPPTAEVATNTDTMRLIHSTRQRCSDLRRCWIRLAL